MCGRFTLTDANQVESKLGLQVVPSFNIAPSQDVLVININLDIGFKKWGISPIGHAKKNTLINARLETFKSKPSFRETTKCVVVADGWYEWTKLRKVKVPYYHYHKDGLLIYFAGLAVQNSGCVIMTCPSGKNIKDIHHRQPLLLDGPEIKNWLSNRYYWNEKNAQNVEARQVSNLVNNPRNDDARNISAVIS